MPPYVELTPEFVSLIPALGDRLPRTTQFLTVPLLLDGIHRVWLARQENSLIRCVTVRNCEWQYPSAAYPNEWSEVQVCAEVPKIKKRYRRQLPYTHMRPLDALRQISDQAKEYGR
jgi:hypothetical protein